MAEGSRDQDEVTKEEAAKRRDEALRRMLNTPPQPHKAKSRKPKKAVATKRRR